MSVASQGSSDVLDSVDRLPLPRRNIVDPENPGVYHCISRCVRREALLSSPERRRWIVNRLETLAGVLAIDVIAFAVMSNHLHVLIRIRPDVARTWTDREVARRRVSILPNRRSRSRSGVDPDAEPTDEEIAALLASPRLLERARSDLSSLGFFHRLLKEPCARAWNREDGVTGHFWEGRFLSPPVLDRAALVRVARYIELNEIRARVADSIPTSIWSSARAQWNRLIRAVQDSIRDASQPVERVLDSITWQPVFPCQAAEQEASASSIEGRDADRVSLVEYLSELDLLGRERHPCKPGFIPASAHELIDEVEASLRSTGSSFASRGHEIRLALASRMRRLRTPHESDPRLRPRRIHRRFGSCYGDEGSVAREAARRGARRLIAIVVAA